jgi:hypothetical protein
MEEDRFKFLGTLKMHSDYLESLVYQDHRKELDYYYLDILNTLESSDDPAEIYRAQGGIRLVKQLIGMFESVYEQIVYEQGEE